MKYLVRGNARIDDEGTGVMTFLRLVGRNLWLVLITVLLAAGGAALYTLRAEPRYEARVTFYVPTVAGAAGQAAPEDLLDQRIRSYAGLVTSDRALRQVARDIGGETPVSALREQLRVRADPAAMMLRVVVAGPRPEQVLRVAEVIAARLPGLIGEVESGAGRPTASAIEVVDGPAAGTAPVAPRPVRDICLAALAGLLAGLLLALLRGVTDTRIRDARTLRRVTGAPVLGEIPYEPAARSAPLIAGRAGRSPRGEAMRKLRTNLRFVNVAEPARVITVCSPGAGEGRTSLSCNLAIALAEAGWRVLLVDADLRAPGVAGQLGLEPAAGLTEVLLGEVSVGDVVQPWGEKSLLVLPAGAVPSNPSELLGSKAMADLLQSLRDCADIVIVDTAPLLAVTDAVVVAVQSDGALLVARRGRTGAAAAAQAADTLQAVSVRLLGGVLNRSRRVRAGTHRTPPAAVAPLPAPTVPARRMPSVEAPGSLTGAAALDPIGEPTQELRRILR